MGGRGRDDAFERLRCKVWCGAGVDETTVGPATSSMRERECYLMSNWVAHNFSFGARWLPWARGPIEADGG